ncbi:aspartate--tRNA(Asp) ligase [Nanobdella aerobiophila]|uniref:Lysine--tRNA ligase n=1 Tax=Nanobdella aerobiophila TaxID=2586965 RepID=A0A915SSJ3_9ARCH|nr:lysine--tRNA ligase [Nanobdella aerobiophila]BBL45441.1 aspartate--tRNA(Asp) ligase [Nanobdella aerobiophila]
MDIESGLEKDIIDRLNILEKIKEKGYNPFPYEFEKTDDIKDIILNQENYIDKYVKITGRIYSIRKHGKISFYDIKEDSYKIQIVLKDDITKRYEDAFNFLQRGDIIGIYGKVGKTKAGELSIFGEEWILLTKALISLPDQWYGLSDTEERYRKRYLDFLMNDNVKELFKIRFKVLNYIRKYFEDLGYIEVQTPILQPIYGGANAKPFITRVNDLKEDWYLRIAPELYLKRYLVGGFDKVFEIATDFRNESIDVTHNPEFTMLEAYEAYSDRDKMMEITEKLVYGIAKDVIGKDYIEYNDKKISLKPPWKRLTMKEAIKEYTNIDVDKLSDKELEEELNNYNIKLELNEYNRGLAITALFENLVEKKLIEPTYIIEHPKESTPLCKISRKDPTLVERAEGYILGVEINNIYSELNDPILQNKLLLEQSKMRELGFEEAHLYDQDFIEALMYGMPPAGGMGLGIDRVIMLINNINSIKEVIPFPMIKKQIENNAVKILTKYTIDNPIVKGYEKY